MICGYDLQRETYLFTNEGVPDELVQNLTFWQWLIEFTQSPKSLMLCCQIFFREYFGKTMTHKVCMLPIPQRLQNVLLLKDLIK